MWWDSPEATGCQREYANTACSCKVSPICWATSELKSIHTCRHLSTRSTRTQPSAGYEPGSHIAQWFWNNPTKTLEDYHTRPLTPPAVTGGEQRIAGLFIGDTDEERAHLQWRWDNDLNMKGHTHIVSQGVRWLSSDGYPYDVWPPEQLAQVKTYWQHQSAILALSGEALTESETTLQYAYGEFKEDHDYAPWQMEIQNPSRYSGGPPRGGPPNPPDDHPSPGKPWSAPHSNHGRSHGGPPAPPYGGGEGGRGGRGGSWCCRPFANGPD